MFEVHQLCNVGLLFVFHQVEEFLGFVLVHLVEDIHGVVR
jgi:hypothetical protein